MRSTPQVNVASRTKSISSPQDIDRIVQEQKDRKRYRPQLYPERYHPFQMPLGATSMEQMLSQLLTRILKSHAVPRSH
jgi:hypothetical protein